MSQTTELEKTNLEAHVDLCAQRYEMLDGRLTNVESELKRIGEDIRNGNSSLIKVIIGTTGTIAVGLISTIGVLISRQQ